MRKLLFMFAAIAIMAGFAGKVMATGDPDATGTDKLSLLLPQLLSLDVYNGTTGHKITLVIPTAGTEVLEKNNVTDMADANVSWLNYTSIATTLKNNEIIASVSAIPAGTTLYVTAADGVLTAGSGGTSGGTSTGKKTLVTASSGVSVLTAIGSCYTGTGTNGSQITYSWYVTDYTKVFAYDNDVTVTYTIQSL